MRGRAPARYQSEGRGFGNSGASDTLWRDSPEALHAQISVPLDRRDASVFRVAAARIDGGGCRGNAVLAFDQGLARPIKFWTVEN